MTKGAQATSSSKQQAQKQAKSKPVKSFAKSPAKSSAKPKERRASWRVIALLWPYFWRDTDNKKRLQLIAALSCLVGAKLVTVTAPAIYREIIDSLNLRGLEDASLVVTIPLALIVAYAFARLGSVVFQELRELAYVPISRRIVRLVCTKVFAHLHSLSLNFHLSRRTGSVIRIMERGQLGIVIFLQFLVLAAAPNLIEVIAVGIILGLVFGPEYAVLVVLIIASYTWFTLTVNEWRMKFRREMNRQENLANARAVDSLINAEVVQSFGNEQFEVDRYDHALKKYEQATIVSTRSLSALNLGQAVIIGIGQAMLMLLAARQYSLGEITLGAFVMINTYLLQLYAPLNFLGTLMRNLRTAMTDLEDLLDLLKNKDQLLDQKNAVERKAIPGKIDFRKVQFSYLEGPAVLKGVSFSVKRNSKVAVVGVSGSGKSTITRLLLRFQNPTKGEILVDDKPLGEYTIASLRACTAIVPQDIVLFNESIAFNIAYGQVTADKKAIIKAAKSAALHDFIMTLPKGYDTEVGERGLKLSGGQRQRVAIARALIKNPAFLILDEATASLDTATERQIQKTLYKISSGRTTLMIAHRLSTVVDCDKIIVLEKGEIIESGEHQELMNKKGAYAKMWQAQQKEKTKAAHLPATQISL